MVSMFFGKPDKSLGGVRHPVFTVALLIHVVVCQARGTRLTIRAVFPAEYSTAQWIVSDDPDFLRPCKRQDFNLCLALNQIIHGLNAVKGDPAVAGGYAQGLGNLPGSKVADTGITDFSLGNHIIQGPQGFFERSMLVKPMQKINIDVFGVQPFKLASKDDIRWRRDPPWAL